MFRIHVNRSSPNQKNRMTKFDSVGKNIQYFYPELGTFTELSQLGTLQIKRIKGEKDNGSYSGV
jgi:hypothetical protein